VAGHTAAIFPHRAAYVATAWRSARTWIGVAYPRDLDRALVELKAAFPLLAENMARLEHVAQQEALHFESEPGAGPDAFTAALREWERATLDGLAALDHSQLEASPGHQLDLPQLRKLEASHG
jgi:hypothetical protein